MTETTYTREQQIENRKTVAAALRSGEFQQTTGALEIDASHANEDQPVGHCCLGVASVCAKRAGAIPEDLELTGYGVAPVWVEEWLGLHGPAGSLGVVDEFGDAATLTALNDNYELTFPEIADIFESEQLLFADEPRPVGFDWLGEG